MDDDEVPLSTRIVKHLISIRPVHCPCKDSGHQAVRRDCHNLTFLQQMPVYVTYIGHSGVYMWVVRAAVKVYAASRKECHLALCGCRQAGLCGQTV